VLEGKKKKKKEHDKAKNIHLQGEERKGKATLGKKECRNLSGICRGKKNKKKAYFSSSNQGTTRLGDRWLQGKDRHKPAQKVQASRKPPEGGKK